MSEDDFKELVYLYLDDEISAEELQLLKSELAQNTARLKEFQADCRMHQALRLALDPSQSAEDKSVHALFSQVSAVKPIDGRSDVSTTFVGWLIAAGLVASFTLSVALLSPELKSDEGFAADSAENNVAVVELRRSDMRRYLQAREQEAALQDASLTAQLRLLGLRPEMLPQDRQLRSVNLATARVQESPARGHEVFQAAERPRLIPAPQILDFPEFPATARASRGSWAGGFKTSLASY